MKKKYIPIAIGVLLILVTAFLINQYIQSAGRNIKIAQQFYKDEEYEKAYKHYLKASKKLPEAHIGAALSVQQLDEKEDPALSHLLKADRDRYHKVSPRAKQHFDQALQEVREVMMRQPQKHKTLGVNQADDRDEMLEKIKNAYEDNRLYDLSLRDDKPLPDELTIEFLGKGDNETMNIRITNGGVIFYRLVIPALVVIQQREQGAYQRMFAAKTFVIFIKPRVEGEIFIIPVYCLDFSKKPPANGMVYTSVRPHKDVPTNQFYNIRSILAATSGKEYPYDVIQRAVNVVTGGWNRRHLWNELSELSKSLEVQFSSGFLSKPQIRAMIAEEIGLKVNQIMADVREVLELAKEFDKKAVVAIGIDLGGFNIGVMVVEVSTGDVIYENEVKTPASREANPVVEEIINQINLAKKVLQGKGRKIEVDGKPNFAIGIGVPGPIYSEEGVIEDLTNFDPKGSWKMFPIKREIENAIVAPTFGDNDANCAALAVILSLSRWGLEIADIIVLTLGMGIGQGIIKDKQVFHGLKGAGEGGHFTAKKFSKELLLSLLGKNFKEKLASSPLKDALCNCGNYMCLEKLASANNIARLAQELLRKEIAERGKIRGETMLSMALENIDALCVGRAAFAEDAIAKEVLQEMGRHLAKAIKRMYDMSGISTFAFVGNMATITGDTPTGALVIQNTNKALKEIYGRDKEAPIKILWLPPDVEGRKAGSRGGAALAIRKIEMRKETKGLR